MKERKYASNETARAVAKEAVWLAWNAVGHPFGAGVLRDNPSADKESVWTQAYEQLDYSGRNGSPEHVGCDYVFGRMMKLRFDVKGDTLEIPDYPPRGDYQAWCHKYPTFDALFDAADAALAQREAA